MDALKSSFTLKMLFLTASVGAFTLLWQSASPMTGAIPSTLEKTFAQLFSTARPKQSLQPTLELEQDPALLESVIQGWRWDREPLIESFSKIRLAAKVLENPIEALMPLLETSPAQEQSDSSHALPASDQVSILKTKALQELQKRDLKSLPNLGLLEKVSTELATDAKDLALVREAFRIALALSTDPNQRYDTLIAHRESSEEFALRDLRSLEHGS